MFSLARFVVGLVVGMWVGFMLVWFMVAVFGL